jgi:hypothetical protein
MAIPGFIKGQLFNQYLERNGVELNIDGLVHCDSTNRRVGIRKNNPDVDFDVEGTVAISTLADTCIVYSDNNKQLTVDGTFYYDPATKEINIDGGYVTGGVSLSPSGLDVSNSGQPFNIISGPNQDINIEAGAGGFLNLNNLVWPDTDGTASQVVSTNGSGVLVWTDAGNQFDLAADAGTDTFHITSGATLTFIGGNGISTSIGFDSVTIDGNPATTTTPGIASFNASFFDVNGLGEVTIPPDSITQLEIAPGSINEVHLQTDAVETDAILDGNVTNAKLQYDSTTLGTTELELGATETELEGLTLLTIDNVQIDGNTISTTDATGNLAINLNNDGILQIGTSAGMVLPSGTTGARPLSPADGTVRFNESTSVAEYYNGTEWVVAGEPFVSITDQLIAPDGIADTFTLNETATITSVIVTLNGLVQQPGTAYNITGTQIEFNEVPEITDIINVRFLSNVSTVSHIEDTTGTTSIEVSDTDINMSVAGNDVVTITTSGMLNLADARSIKLPVYTAAAAQAIATPAVGEVIYVSNGDSGLPTLAVYDGINWRRISFGATISAT